MTDLVFAAPGFSQTTTVLLREPDETCAVVLCNVVSTGRSTRLLVKEVHFPTPDAYLRRSPIQAVLKPEFVVSVTRKAKDNHQALVFVHTHPHSEELPDFSEVDDAGERSLANFLDRRIPGLPHAALVVGPNGCRARLLGTAEPVRVVEVGKQLKTLYPTNTVRSHDPMFDRQVRAFGAEGQAVLRNLRVGIVGLGGTGSAVAQQLAYLGVTDFVLIDPESIDKTNLNRLVGAVPTDVGLPKVDVVARHIQAVRPVSSVKPVIGSVLHAETARLLLDTDFFFCCTDSHASRAVLCQLAYQYLLPCIDLGVTLVAHQGRVERVAGRVQMLSPGLGCLVCGQILDSDAVRREFMSDAQRHADPYFIGPGAPQPAVVSINLTVASLAVSMFLGALTDAPVQSRLQFYNGISGAVRPARQDPDAACIVCSARGALARGDEWPLPESKS